MRASSSPSRAPSSAARHVERLLDGEATDVDEAAEHVGCEAGALLVGEERDLRSADGVVRSCCASVSTISSPASTPRLPSKRPPVRTVSMCEPTITAAAVGSLPGACGDDVADGVDRHVHAEIAHPRHHEIATLAIDVGQRQAGRSHARRSDRGRRRSHRALRVAATTDRHRRADRATSAIGHRPKSNDEISRSASQNDCTEPANSSAPRSAVAAVGIADVPSGWKSFDSQPKLTRPPKRT